MQLVGLDKSFETVVGNLPYINLQWQRAYYTPGEFTVQIQAKDYHPGLAYLYTTARPEVGMVQKVAYKNRAKGHFVELSGFFLEKMLDDKVTWPTFYCNGNIETEVLRMVAQYKADIPHLVVDAAKGLGANTEWQDTGTGLAATAAARLQEQQLACRCSYSPQDGAVHFSVWQGKNRTQNQSANSFAVFSDEFANIGDVEIVTDDSNFKNYAVVSGRGAGDERITAIADGSGGAYRRQVWVDSRNSRFDAGEQTLAQYQAGLRADGFNTLTTKYYVLENTRISLTTALGLGGGTGGLDSPLPHTMGGGRQALAYMQDYDLGDLCDVVVAEAGISIQARIIGVREVIKHNRHGIDLELGEAVLTRTEKARL